MVRAWFLLVVVVLGACAPRAQLVVVPQALVSQDDTRAVFVGTTRQNEGRLGFSGKRALTPSYARFDISVPPNRSLGEITWPEGQVDPATQFLATREVLYPDDAAFRSGLGAALRARPRGDREVVIYVHGFNNNFADGMLRITQLAHDFQFPGVAVHYSWPSAASALGYAYDRDSVLFSRDGLESLIRQVQGAGAEDIIVVAHSVGSLLVMETLRQMAVAKPGSVAREISGLILISPDIDVEVFKSQATRIGTLPDPFGIFVSERDRALLLSARLTGQRNRLGNISSLKPVEEFKVQVIDVTSFSSGAGHFTLGSSPEVISIFARGDDLGAAFRGDRSGRAGLIPGTLLTLQNATEIILLPVTGIADAISQ